MTYQELLSMDLTGKNVVIIGNSQSGKTHLAKHLHNRFPGHDIFHSDDYMDLDFKIVPDFILSAVNRSNRNVIIEGQQIPRMLKKLKGQDIGFKPDLVIRLHHYDEVDDSPLAKLNAEILKDLPYPVTEVLRF